MSDAEQLCQAGFHKNVMTVRIRPAFGNYPYQIRLACSVCGATKPKEHQ